MVTARDFVEALNRGDRAGGVAAARQLLDEGAELGAQWHGIARFAAVSGEWTLALAAMDRFVQREPTDADGLLAKAAMLAEAGRLADAVDAVEPLEARKEKDPRVAHFLGVAWTQLGDAARARDYLSSVVTEWPMSGPAWLALSAVHKFAPDDPLLGLLEKMVGQAQGTQPSNRATLFYALGKARDDLGRHDDAFAAYSEGASLERGERAYDPEADRRDAEQIARQPVVSTSAGRNRDAPGRALFVMGLPRSGTTLVEQILASHSSVSDGGEINLLSTAASPRRGLGPAQVTAHYVDGEAGPFTALNDNYAHLLEERFGPEGKIVDKSLGNTRFAGLIAAAMPDAPIIWLRRDPFDTAWSCFRTHFNLGLGWSFDLADIARHFAAEEIIFRHWKAALGDRMLVIPYEELVAAPDEWIARILAHSGLPPEEGVSNFHTNRRAVTTSSVLQVRKPINAAGIGASANYRQHMEPFAAEYERQMQALSA